jgi:hypothetical protein
MADNLRGIPQRKRQLFRPWADTVHYNPAFLCGTATVTAHYARLCSVPLGCLFL